MALDEPKDTDTLYEVEGFKYVVDKMFMEKVEPIKVDFMDIGFKVTANIELSSGCGSCNTAGSCC
jgi:Fe-S cluster assembly iron-binding protein IscA